MSWYFKIHDKHQLVYNVLDKDMIRYEVLPYLPVPKHVYILNSDLAEDVPYIFSSSFKLAVKYRLRLHFRSVVYAYCMHYYLQLLALVVVNVRVFCAVTYAHVHVSIIFCLFFSVKFNIMSALFVRQLPTLPQKIDSREGLSRCKGGVVLGCGRMNIYYNKPSFAPTFGPFFAKCGAIWC